MLEPDSRQLDNSNFNSKSCNNLNGWSSTIQLLLPVAALAFIWGRRGIITKFFLQFDKNCISVICPSLKEKQKLLQWIECYLPTAWLYSKDSSLDSPIHFWTDGSLLCNLINSFIPEACPNPLSHCNQPPSHGQALAYKYLGIAPVFTNEDFIEGTLTNHYEELLIQYLQQVREACEREPKPHLKYSSNYIVKGMGLVSGEENRKMSFYIYVNSFDFFNANDIIVNIRAPENIYETLSIPSNCIKQKLFPHLFSRKFANLSQSECLLLKPITNLESFNEQRNSHSNKRLPLAFDIEEDRVKVVYIPRSMGIYEVSIITNGCHVLGSPFPVSILKNVSGVHEDIEDSFPTVTMRKIIRRTILSQAIDFLDDKHEIDTHQSRPDVTEENIEIKYHHLMENDACAESTESSPICQDHIESEVNNNLASSLIPTRNLEKICDKEVITRLKDQSIQELNIQKVDSSEQDDTTTNAIKDIDVRNKEHYTNENALNILNYLPHLKYDRSLSCDELNRDSPSLKPSLKSVVADDCFEFRNKLIFWESRSSLGTMKYKLKQRRSLPNLLVNSSSLPFHSYDKSEFKIKQKYWKFLSSQTIDCMESNSCYSLNNIFTHVHNGRNRLNPYFDSMDFKKKFKECREFWEKLSSQYHSREYLHGVQHASSDIDSGFENSEAFESLTRSNNSLDLDTNLFDHSIFQKRQHFWETLNDEIEAKQNLKMMSLGTLQEGDNEFIKGDLLNEQKDTYFFNEVTLDIKNLTDDFKSISGTRETMRTRFYKNKDFFRSLEDSIR